ncbi:MAG: glycoside hydrolase, partial [Bacteroidetes bacterium]|nr:glycoside hydrolase [Bacteroidota bacterium]
HQAAAWEYHEVKGAPVEPEGTWDLQFLSGGPELPESIQLEKLHSWTEINPMTEAFSGTVRYKMEFENPDSEVTHWLLDLGDVRESARVWVNGQSLGCLWSVPFSTVTDKLQKGRNTLEIEVTNLSANRLRNLERKGIEWKIFYEINMVNRHYEEFDASIWDPMPSGLLGKVTLTPISKKAL